MKPLLMLFSLIALCSCKKDLLNAIPTSEITEPKTIEDFYALLDNENTMDQSPVLGEASSDDFFFRDSYFSQRPALEQNTYVWAKDIYQGSNDIYDWNTPYNQILTCNVVLTGCAANTSAGRSSDWQDLKADALFKRSFAFFNLTQIFAPPFDSATMTKPLGVPLRLTTSVNEITFRPTIQENYDRIISDLQDAIKNTHQTIPGSIRNRPCTAAIWGLLARIYLSMRNYPAALQYADSSLLLYDTLIDYNAISTTATFPFPVNNIENLYTARVPSSTFQSILPYAGQAYIDSSLYQSYATNDLRKLVFFVPTDNKLFRRKNFYDGNFATLYTGLAVDEIYLIKSECLIRTSRIQEGIALLNKLVRTRFKKDAFPAFNAPDYPTALQLVLTERRKEMVMRGSRFSDLRRLNLEGGNITLYRIINGTTYTLPPNSHLYVLPIPPNLGLPQNER